MLKLEQFQEAKKRVDEVIIPTPLIYSDAFSKECKNEVYIKPENLQRTGAFKIRGAYNKIVKMDDSAKQHGLLRCADQYAHRKGCQPERPHRVHRFRQLRRCVQHEHLRRAGHQGQFGVLEAVRHQQAALLLRVHPDRQGQYPNAVEL